MTPAGHSPLGASAAARWFACPGSVALCAGIPNASSIFAREGTAAHEVGEKCLRVGKDADHFIGAKIAVEGETFVVDEDMAEAVQVYVDAVRERVGKGDELLVEERFHLKDLDPQFYGTSDALILHRKRAHLTVIDYKHGAGVAVEVQGNRQLRYYGLGALMRMQRECEIRTVDIIVVQPRCDHPDGPVRVETLDAHDLIFFGAELVAAAAATRAPDAPLVEGAHCRFCPAGATCPERERKVYEMAFADFGPDGDVYLSDAKSFGDNSLTQIVANAKRIEQWCKDVMAYAHERAENGDRIPGMKLVAKRATRKWRDEETARARLVAYGCDTADLYAEPKFKSPAQVEKVVGKKAFGELERELVENVSSGTILVPEEDKRPAVTRSKPEEDFA